MLGRVLGFRPEDAVSKLGIGSPTFGGDLLDLRLPALPSFAGFAHDFGPRGEGRYGKKRSTTRWPATTATSCTSYS